MDLFLTPEEPCSYLPEQQSRSLLVDPEAELNPQLYARLLAHGFRRSGIYVYTTRCDNCQSCNPIRLPAAQFQPNRSQRRIQRMNSDLRISEVDEITDEHVLLYQKYMQNRHADSAMANYQFDECQNFMQADWCSTHFLEFRQQQQLVAVAVTDRLPDSLSAVYTYFDPAYDKRALGVYAILHQIERVQQLSLKWLYLGFWIPKCRKMSYKVNYRPFELKTGKEWQLYDKL